MTKDFIDLYSEDYEPIGDIALLEEYLESYQTDSDWDNWLAELGDLKTKVTPK